MRRIDYITNSYEPEEIEVTEPVKSTPKEVSIGAIFYLKDQVIPIGVVMKMEENSYVVRMLNHQLITLYPGYASEHLATVNSGEMIMRLEKEIFHSLFEVL